MLEKLNELLKGKFEVLHIEQREYEDIEGVISYIDIVVRSDNEASDVCAVYIKNFEVAAVKGFIHMEGIKRINEALLNISQRRI